MLTLQCASSNSKPTWMQPDTQWAHTSLYLAASVENVFMFKKAQSGFKLLLRATPAKRGHSAQLLTATYGLQLDYWWELIYIHLLLCYYKRCATALRPTHSLENVCLPSMLKVHNKHCIIVYLQQIGREIHLYKFGAMMETGQRFTLNGCFQLGKTIVHCRFQINQGI